MPLREYKCLYCGKVFEELILKIDEEDELRCPHCKGENLSRLFSAFGVRGTEKKVGNSACASCASKTCSTCQ